MNRTHFLRFWTGEPSSSLEESKIILLVNSKFLGHYKFYNGFKEEQKDSKKLAKREN